RQPDLRHRDDRQQALHERVGLNHRRQQHHRQHRRQHRRHQRYHRPDVGRHQAHRRQLLRRRLGRHQRPDLRQHRRHHLHPALRPGRHQVRAALPEPGRPPEHRQLQRQGLRGQLEQRTSVPPLLIQARASKRAGKPTQTWQESKMRNFMILGILSLAVLTLGACTGGGGGGAATLPPTGGTGNSAPVFTSTAPTAAVVGQLYSYQATASDANGDPLTWSLGIAPGGMSVNASALVTWTPSAGQVGSHNVSLSANDGQASPAQSWTINASAAGGGNQPPVITSSAPTTATEGQLYSYQAAASDPNGDTLTWTLTTKPTGMTVGASTGLVQWTPRSEEHTSE